MTIQRASGITVIPLSIVEAFDRRAPFRLHEATFWCVAKRGSHTYGTNGPDSDIDYMFVIVPPLRTKFGYNPVNRKTFEGVEFIENGFDCVFYTLDKFVTMLFRCSPQSLELLALREEDYFIRHRTFPWIRRRWRSFLSRDAVYHTFKGMATSKSTTNVMHPIRLLRMCIELLESARLRVYRDEDADELRAIKLGEWDAKRAAAELDRLTLRVDQARQLSILPVTADHALVDAVLYNVYLDVYRLRSRKESE